MKVSLLFRIISHSEMKGTAAILASVRFNESVREMCQHRVPKQLMSRSTSVVGHLPRGQKISIEDIERNMATARILRSQFCHKLAGRLIRALIEPSRRLCVFRSRDADRD